ncbi:e3 ubiquitin-protein ligase [Anaeramoeba ignava]|uniref:E3 ubiquitin-protein ligase n=1 Tax=Anaeramoeba ignava TaxID=1746090 RepID=A0A9Q0LU56_ANAIG|nr:e3 ubiquitin-protein ligase [Anaeramoeba ignava]
MENFESNQNEHICLTCINPISIFALGQCNHRQICWRCFLRMDHYNNPRTCCVCKSKVNNVIMTRNTTKKFQDYNLETLGYNTHERYYYDDESILEEINEANQYTCPICKLKSRNKFDFKSHLKNFHDKFICDICTDNNQFFNDEIPIYTFSELKQHKKQHPVCSCCFTSFFDNEALQKHCDENHLVCHLCQAESNYQEYFSSYEELEKHFDKEHFICKNPTCRAMRFIVFNTSIELQAHAYEFHQETLPKIDKKKGFKLQLPDQEPEINYRNQRYQRHQRNQNNNNFSNSNPNENLNQNQNQNQNQNENENENEKNSDEENLEKIKKEIESNPYLKTFDEERKQILQKRNKQLVQNLKKKLSQKKFQNFVKKSSEFQKGIIPTFEYFQVIFQILGDKLAKELFNEIVDTLPDHTKQKELRQIYEKKQQELKDFPSLLNDLENQRTKNRKFGDWNFNPMTNTLANRDKEFPALKPEPNTHSKKSNSPKKKNNKNNNKRKNQNQNQSKKKNQNHKDIPKNSYPDIIDDNYRVYKKSDGNQSN